MAKTYMHSNGIEAVQLSPNVWEWRNPGGGLYRYRSVTHVLTSFTDGKQFEVGHQDTLDEAMDYSSILDQNDGYGKAGEQDGERGDGGPVG